MKGCCCCCCCCCIIGFCVRNGLLTFPVCCVRMGVVVFILLAAFVLYPSAMAFLIRMPAVRREVCTYTGPLGDRYADECVDFVFLASMFWISWSCFFFLLFSCYYFESFLLLCMANLVYCKRDGYQRGYYIFQRRVQSIGLNFGFELSTIIWGMVYCSSRMPILFFFCVLVYILLFFLCRRVKDVGGSWRRGRF